MRTALIIHSLNSSSTAYGLGTIQSTTRNLNTQMAGPFTNHVILGKLFNLSLPQFPNTHTGNNNRGCFKGMIGQ